MASRKKKKSGRTNVVTVPHPESQGVRFWGLLLFLFGSTILLYWPATEFPFLNFDDNLYVTDNARVLRGLEWDTFRWAFLSLEASNWHPLTWLSHSIDVSLWGANQQPSTFGSPQMTEFSKWDASASGHHLTNILLHAINAGLVFVAFSLLTGRLWGSFLLALLFAWHPLRVESVAWIAERKDLLSSLFGLLTIVSYRVYVQKTSSWTMYLVTIGCFAAGLMSKPMIITLPFALLLLDYWPLRRLTWDQRLPTRNSFVPLIVEKLPMFALVVGSAAITYLAQLQGGAVVTEQLPLGARLSNALISYFVYIRQTLAPLQLAVFYPHSQGQVPWLRTLLAFLAIVALSGVTIRWRDRWPFLIVGWLWYLGTLVPVIGLVQVGGQAHADRYTYLPTLGISIIVIWLGTVIAEQVPRLRWTLNIAFTGCLVACAVGTRYQLEHWRSSRDLFLRAVQVSPHSGLAWSNLGAAYMAEGRIAEATAAYRRAVDLSSVLDTKAGLATALAAGPDVNSAIVIFKELIAEYPTEYNLANNLAWILATATHSEFRDPPEAVRLAESADRNSGGENPTILDTLAVAYAADGRLAEAITTIDRAILAAQNRQDKVTVQQLQARREEYQEGL